MSPLDRLQGESDLQWARRAAALIRAPRATGFVAAVEIASRNGVVIGTGSPISVADMERLGFRDWQGAFESMLENGEIIPVGDGAQGQRELVAGEGSAATADLTDQVVDLLCGTLATDAGRRGTSPVTAYSLGAAQLGPPGVAGASAPTAPRSGMWPLRDMVADTRLALEAGEAFDRRKAIEQQRAHAEAASQPTAPAMTDPTKPWLRR